MFSVFGAVLAVTPGRGGGIALAKEPGLIRLGDVVRDAEPNMRLAECFDRRSNHCVLTPVCSLKPVLNEAAYGIRYGLEPVYAAGSARWGRTPENGGEAGADRITAI